MNLYEVDTEYKYHITYPCFLYIGQMEDFILSAIECMARNNMDKHKDITIWVKGTSGVSMATLFVYLLRRQYAHMNCRINYISKQGEIRHDTQVYYDKQDFNIIIDDFVLHGTTLQDIYEFSMKHVTHIDLLITSYVGYWDDHWKIDNVICKRDCFIEN